jgi:drug/metabolite transporter (DMT)-like permease
MNTALGIIAILLWSTTIAFSRTISEQLGPYTAGAAVYLVAGVLSCLFAAYGPGSGAKGLRRLSGLPRRYLFGCGALFVAYILLIYAAIGTAKSRPEVLAVGLANYLWPSLTLVFALPIHRQRAGWQMPVGVLLGLGGSWLALMGDQAGALGSLLSDPSSLLPVILALAAAVLWGLYSNLTRLWGSEHTSGAPLFLLASGLAFVPLHFWAGEPLPSFAPGSPALAILPALLYMAFLPTCLAYVFWDLAMQRGDFLLVASLSYFTPILSTLVSVVVLQVALTPLLGVAAALVTVGALLARGGMRSGANG